MSSSRTHPHGHPSPRPHVPPHGASERRATRCDGAGHTCKLSSGRSRGSATFPHGPVLFVPRDEPPRSRGTDSWALWGVSLSLPLCVGAAYFTEFPHWLLPVQMDTTELPAGLTPAQDPHGVNRSRSVPSGPSGLVSCKSFPERHPRSCFVSHCYVQDLRTLSKGKRFGGGIVRRRIVQNDAVLTRGHVLAATAPF